MTRRGLTPIQQNFPPPEDFVEAIEEWKRDGVDLLFSYLWKGFDDLINHQQIEVSATDENIERSITQLACQPIRDQIPKLAPYYLEHHFFEDETRLPAPASPPAPDISFVLRANPRATLPLEAKVLPTEGTLSEYVKEIDENFLTCRYAPFSSHGGMLGYLLEGSPNKFLEKLAGKLESELEHHAAFPSRPHKISHHSRTGELCSTAPSEFKCHHLIFLFSCTEND